MDERKAYKSQNPDNTSMLPGDLKRSPDELIQDKVFKPKGIINNIQAPSMTRKGNAGLPVPSKKSIENGKVYKSQKINNKNIYPGNPQGLPDESFISEGTLVFIDANFLSKLSKHFGNGKYLVYDLIKFSENLSRKQKLNCKGVFYYTAPPFQGSIPTIEETRKQEGYNRFINKLKEKGVIIREGRCQRLKCDGDFVYKQKAVDILLARDLMSVPLDYPKVKRIILISSDSDFVLIVESLEEKGVKTILYTYYEKIRDTPFSVSNHLIKSVHKYVLLTKDDFTNSPLNKEVKNEK